MVRRESHTPISGGASLRAMERERRALHRESEEREKLRRRVAVAEYFSTLDQANSSVSLGSVLEVVYPYTKRGRVLSLQKGRMIPAVISHPDGRSTVGGWVDYRKITGRYLLVEETEGFIVTPPEERDDFYATEVVLQDGRVGKLLKPNGGYHTPYSIGETTVDVGTWANRFENRNCQAVWGPSLSNPEQLTSFRVEQLTQLLSGLIVDTTQE